MVNVLVVVVEPSQLGGIEEGGVDGFRAEGTEGEGLEAQEGAEFVLRGRLTGEEVFVADAVMVLAIEARFVGGHHAGEDFLGIEVGADGLRALVNVEEVAHAVPGAMTEIAEVHVEWQAGGKVEMATF